MQVTEKGSVRVDLVGGTLDLEPINLILPNVVTLNVATSLKANVELHKSDFEGIQIESEDYSRSYTFEKSEFNQKNLYQTDHFKEMAFIVQILDLFHLHSHLKIRLSSGAPAGSGLGGSSAMGVTLYKALCSFTDTPFSIEEAVTKVRATEGRILNQGVPGYQDYYPALKGGILCLRGLAGKIDCEQLFSENLKTFLEDHITLVYSGVTRLSGINNWEVYKGFFDKNESIRQSLEDIANVSYQAYLAIKEQKYEKLLELIGQEGKFREKLAPTITPYEVQELFVVLMHEFRNIGMKMCGAGGGGCFIITHKSADKAKIKQIIADTGMEVLDFSIENPIQ